MQGYFNALRAEKLGKHIHVTLLCPGPTFTNFLAECYTANEGEVSKVINCKITLINLNN